MSVPTINAGLQPWNQVIFPGSESNYPLLPIMSPHRAKSLPAVGRVIGIIAGMIKQCSLENFDGTQFLARPPFFQQPDPDKARAWWVGVQVEDYLLNGNAIHYVTATDSYGWPLAATWIPAEWVAMTLGEDGKSVAYWVGGMKLDNNRVIHVQRGADRWFPFRGVGLVEQHMQQLGLVDDQERYQRSLMSGSAVPSVAVVTPNSDLSPEEADAAQEKFIEKYGGEGRKPGVFPAGTQIVPLAWSPADAELNAARQMSLVDVANMANMDSYFLNAPSGSYTYKTPAPLYLNLIRQTINPITEDFEGVWSMKWVPRGRFVKFDKRPLLGDDMSTMVATAVAAVAAKLWTQEEARAYLGFLGPLPAELKPQPVPPALAQANQQQQDNPAADQQPADQEAQ